MTPLSYQTAQRRVSLSQRACLSLLLGLLLCAAWTALPSPKAHAQFMPRFSTTTTGGLAITGNSLGLSSDNQGNVGTRGNIGAFITTNTNLSAGGSWPAGTTLDWQQNGASAILDLPAGATVLHAELIWGGFFNGLPQETMTPVRLEGPGMSATLDPNQSGVETFTESDWDFYVHSMDVTETIRGAGAGQYTVLGVPAELNCSCTRSAAGWTLLVAWSTPDAPLRNLSIFAGMERGGGNPVTLNGICTASSGVVGSRVMVSAIEGDAGGRGDQMVLGGNEAAMEPLSGPNNPTNNFFASQINTSQGLLDTRGTFGNANRPPGGDSTPGRHGWDVTGVDASGFIPPGSTRAVVQGITSNDQYALTMVGVEIDTSQPVFDTSTSEVSTSNAFEGDEVTYTATLRNTGDETAQNLTFQHQLAPGMDFIAGSFCVDGGCSGANPTTGSVQVGAIPPGGEMVVEFRARVADTDNQRVFEGQSSWDFTYTTCALPTQTGQYNSNTTFVNVADVAVEITGAPSGLVSEGQTVAFTLRVRNQGGSATSNVAVRNALPEGFAYVAGSTRINDNTLSDVAGRMPFDTWRRVGSPGQPAGVIQPGRSAVITYRAQAMPREAGSLTNTLEVDVNDQATGNDLTATFTIPVTLCGDGTQGGLEACDDANARTEACTYGAQSCSVCTNVCQIGEGVTSWCGDGLVDEFEGEECDDGPNNGSENAGGCSLECTRVTCNEKTGDGCLDEDGDGIIETRDPNDQDPDIDDDGYCDGPNTVEGVCIGGEDLNNNGDPRDDNTDGDGLADYEDEDDDNDGVLTINDNCHLVSNRDQADSDDDGIGDLCDDTPGDNFGPVPGTSGGGGTTTPTPNTESGNKNVATEQGCSTLPGPDAPTPWVFLLGFGLWWAVRRNEA